MTSQDEQFGQAIPQFSCGQIEAERNHDELHVRPAKTGRRSDSYKKDTLKQYYKDLDTYHTHCNDFGKRNKPAWTDERFIKYIFNNQCHWVPEGHIKNHLFNNIGVANCYNPAYEIWYKGQSWKQWQKNQQVQVGLGFDTCEGKLYSYSDLTNTVTLRSMIDRINHHLTNAPPPPPGQPAFQANPANPANKVGAYMFVDVGKGLLTRLNLVMNANDPIFHVINSQASLADSATEGKDIYNTGFFNNQIHCWWYTIDLFIPPYDPQDVTPAIPYNHSFHTGLQCQMYDDGPTNPRSRAITQEWSYPQGKVLYTTYNASVDNNAGNVNIDIDNATKSDSGTVSMAYHRKRSGDGFAIWFMEQFATILCTGNSTDFFHTCGYGMENPTTILGDGLVDFINSGVSSWDAVHQKKYIRYHSFFITGDYPAFCWAAYCHCNVILHQDNEGGGRALIFIADTAAICY